MIVDVFSVGLTYAAVHYYKKGLTFPPVIEDGEVSIWYCFVCQVNTMQLYLNYFLCRKRRGMGRWGMVKCFIGEIK